MKQIRYEDVPAMCDQLLKNVELAGVMYEIQKNGRPYMRIEPVDDATKVLFAASSSDGLADLEV